MTFAEGLPGVEIWRGGVNTWDCDEMGHMNVRHYVGRAMEGLVGLAAELGMPHAFSPFANATLLVKEHHIRFLREAHAGAPLYMLGGVIEMGECDAKVLQLLVHPASGELAATFQTTVVHATPREGQVFPWPTIARERAEALRVEVPEKARARSLDLSPFASTASLARAEALGLTRIGLGGLLPSDCDVFGRMRAEQFIGRVSDGIGAFIHPFRDTIVAHADPKPARFGGAVLEYRIAYLAWPRVGDRVDIRSGLLGADARTMRMVHWMLDPATGEPWGTSQAVAVTFDLDARKVVPVTDAAQAALAARAVADLAL
ncbi:MULTISPECIES: thioesterase family protein [Caulobacter]|jgi:acyl-CoA thioester hydrolase|uniref:Putative thioesterase n=1 Tax=Caulobacter vibrioides OR37 TaxID=1292034 RepID=R0CZV0_CAUVI|nr:MULTISPECIES: thioesterase family protein [Caulobacter]ENZ81981.1 putative thioesterase [Caulobacter vibrioides OR37]MBQ1561005.1 thioesterase family protein [Caulobacter sp.]